MRHIFIYLASLLLLPAGCSKENQPGQSDEPGAMRFRAFLQEGDDIRPLGAVSRAVDGTIDNGYYLFVSKYNTVDYICDNMKIAADGTMATPCYWLQGTNTYRVEAYATPFGSKYTKNTASNKVYLQYTVPDDPKLQEDLLTAYLDNLSVDYNKPMVNLYFRHALSRVMFKVLRTKSGPTLYDMTLKVTYAPNKVLKSINAYLIPPHTAATAAYHSGTYTIGSPITHSSADMQPVPVGDMIVVPQTFAKGALTIEMAYKVSPSSPEVTLTTELQGFTIKKEEQIDIVIGYSIDVEQLVVQDVTLSAWNSTSGDVGIYK